MTDWIFYFLLENFILQNFCICIEKMPANTEYIKDRRKKKKGQEKGHSFLIIVEYSLGNSLVNYF